LRIARTKFLDFHSERAVVVERFDRAVEASGEVVRTHQEDVCQALGIRQKYEEYGGPSAPAIIRLLRESAATAQQGRSNVNDFVDGLIFNTVIAATDAHARNYALVLEGDRVQFAPLYDVATSLAYGPPGAGPRRLSMQIGGTFEASSVDDDTWLRFARENRLDHDRVLDRVDHVRGGVVDAFDAAVLEMAADDWDSQVSEVAQRLLPALATHLAQ
jgi:serine/threonine-protein kinase HipA